jgi:hypothetical protein
MVFCLKCFKYFSEQFSLNRHLNKRKKNCDNYENCNLYIQHIDKEIKNTINLSLENKYCLFCEKSMVNVNRHIQNSCVVKKELEDKKNEIIKQKLILLEEQNKILKNNNTTNNSNSNNSNSNNNITINTTNTTNNNNMNNIIINPFGKEDLSHIQIEDYLKFMNTFFPGFVGYIEKVHCDDNAPQNHNIFISNLKSKYISIHDGEKWITKDKNDVINTLILKKQNQLSSMCEKLENENKIDKKIIEHYEEFCEHFKNIEAQKTTKNNIITMLYDNRNKISNLKNIKSIK